MSILVIPMGTVDMKGLGHMFNGESMEATISERERERRRGSREEFFSRVMMIRDFNVLHSVQSLEQAT